MLAAKVCFFGFFLHGLVAHLFNSMLGKWVQEYIFAAYLVAEMENEKEKRKKGQNKNLKKSIVVDAWVVWDGGGAKVKIPCHLIILRI